MSLEKMKAMSRGLWSCPPLTHRMRRGTKGKCVKRGTRELRIAICYNLHLSQTLVIDRAGPLSVVGQPLGRTALLLG
jgi:hypothetical protein